MSKILLLAQNIGHSFDYPLYENINLSLQEGHSVAIVGVSGSGKSTLLHNLSTFLKPQKGKVFIFDKDIYSQKEDNILKIRRYDIGVIFQFHYLFRGFSAKENIQTSAIMANKEIDLGLMERFGIKELLDKNAMFLSGGQQQRVSIARVLTKKPRIIFADEPTGNLDKQTADEVMGEIFDYIKTNGAAMVLVTHDMTLANRCDIVYSLQGGILKMEKTCSG